MDFLKLMLTVLLVIIATLAVGCIEFFAIALFLFIEVRRSNREAA